MQFERLHFFAFNRLVLECSVMAGHPLVSPGVEVPELHFCNQEGHSLPVSLETCRIVHSLLGIALQLLQCFLSLPEYGFFERLFLFSSELAQLRERPDSLLELSLDILQILSDIFHDEFLGLFKPIAHYPFKIRNPKQQLCSFCTILARLGCPTMPRALSV